MKDKRYYLAVRALIRDSRGRCLLIRRSNQCHSFVGQWEWPGGKVEEGEAFDVALRREIREEIGLKVRFTRVVGAYGFTFSKKEKRITGKKEIVVLCMEAKRVGGTFRLSREHDDAKWVFLKKIRKQDMVKGLFGMIRIYLTSQKRGGKKHG